MKYHDLRDFMSQLEKTGELKRVGVEVDTRPAKMMGKMTLSYGAAQILGPAITGLLGTYLGSYNAGLYFAAAVMVVGTLLLAVLKVVEKRDAAKLLLTVHQPA